MKPWYRNSTLQMDDAEMEWLQKQDAASCAVWEWIKGDCQKRGAPEVRTLSKIELSTISSRLGIDSPRFSQISHYLQEVGWIQDGRVSGWEKWQDQGRTVAEDALRKQVEYWKKKADNQPLANVDNEVVNHPPKTSQASPLRGEERRSDQVPPNPQTDEGSAAPPERFEIPKQAKIAEQPIQATCDDLHVHAELVKASGHSSKLNPDALKRIRKFLKSGYTAADIAVTARWAKWRNLSASEERFKIKISLKLIRDLADFDSRLGEARAWERNQPKPRTARSVAMSELRPAADGEAQNFSGIQTAAEILPRLIADLQNP